MRLARVRPAGIRVRFVEAAEFNELLDSTGNKNLLHFSAVADLVQDLLERRPDSEMTIRIGKLSGRTFYLRPLLERFGRPILIRSESRRRSKYVMADGGRSVSISFLMDGDATDFGIALASIVAKYLRESWMRLFNAYWAGRVAGLWATTGYGSEARRFFESIRPGLGRPEREVLRLK